MKNPVIYICLMAMMLISCSKTQTVSGAYAYSSFETTSLGVGHDGTMTVRAWGGGNKKSEAIEQARKNAVYDVLFKGVKDSSGTITALVHEANAAERYAEYFNPFFSDKGAYKKFSKLEKGSSTPMIEAKGTNRVTYGVVVTVDRDALKKQLIKDGILSEQYRY